MNNNKTTFIIILSLCTIVFGWCYFLVKRSDQDLRHQPFTPTNGPVLIDTAHVRFLDSLKTNHLTFCGIPVDSYWLNNIHGQRFNYAENGTSYIYLGDSGKITLSYQGHTVIFSH